MSEYGITGTRSGLPYLEEEDYDGQQVGQVAQQSEDVHGGCSCGDCSGSSGGSDSGSSGSTVLAAGPAGAGQSGSEYRAAVTVTLTDVAALPTTQPRTHNYIYL